MRQPPPTLLDPDARAVMDRVNALNAPGYESMSPEVARAIAAQLLRNAPIPKVRVGAVQDIALATAAAPMRARHYAPFGRRSGGAAPALIYLHGGGWTLGDLDTMDHLCRMLVRLAGIAILSLDYPLAPEVRFPDTLDRCAEAVRAAFAESGALGLDPARIGIGGDSAGGNLAAALALMARDGALPALRAQCLLYPALDLRAGYLARQPPPETLFMRGETMAWFLANYLGRAQDAFDWRASPLLADSLAGLPPSYLLTAGHDVLRAEGRAYAARLTEARVTTVARDFPGQIHNFLAMPHAIPTAHAAIADLAEFLLVQLCGETGA